MAACNELRGIELIQRARSCSEFTARNPTSFLVVTTAGDSECLNRCPLRSSDQVESLLVSLSMAAPIDVRDRARS